MKVRNSFLSKCSVAKLERFQQCIIIRRSRPAENVHAYYITTGSTSSAIYQYSKTVVHRPMLRQTKPIMNQSNIHLLLLHADPEITFIELIGNVPTQGAKLPSLLHQSMEETETKQQLAPRLGFVATLEEGGVRYWVVEVGTEEVGTHSFWRFICHLHPCTDGVSGYGEWREGAMYAPFWRMETGKSSEG